MSQAPENLLYTKEHEWVRMEGTTAYIGITDFAQSELGDIVFVELPDVGSSVQAGETFGTVESVKTVSDLYAPVSGKVVKINSELADTPEKVNEQPYEGGWMIAVEIESDHPEGLLSAKEYQSLIAE
ncbi:glycine cleavage system protein GcvH [Sulfoacidibacillus thermotolerans]|uniref:Glycine cleavage system H protein n=1 Tax=Sulfoacidibacillus thermotolerans TaxID=1765684 RepID=A0A2U3DCS0_SULT2|nr:glycine cleavage system protein GcvH [Sulfoacidibacillus thermotolerans]PWI59068.1 glycine cleavage system protein H [Sulfoacidibacillus thermotolerans]